jgi:hypothetical protein
LLRLPTFITDAYVYHICAASVFTMMRYLMAILPVCLFAAILVSFAADLLPMSCEMSRRLRRADYLRRLTPICRLMMMIAAAALPICYDVCLLLLRVYIFLTFDYAANICLFDADACAMPS